MHPHLYNQLRRGVVYEAPNDGGTGGGSGDQGGSGDGTGGGTGDGSGAGDGGAGDGSGDGSGSRPSEAEAKLLREVMSKKKDLEALNKKLGEATTKLKSFDGIDPEKVRQLLADQAKAEEAQLTAKGDFDRLKQRLVEEHTKELGTHTKTIADLKAQLESSSKMVNDLTVGSSFDSSAFIKDDLVLTPSKARVIYGTHFDIEDGKVVGYDKPRGSAERTKLIDGKGDPLPFEGALKKLVEADPDRERLVRSKLRSGAGSDSGNGKGGQQQQQQTDLTGRDRIAAGLRAGLARKK